MFEKISMLEIHHLRYTKIGECMGHELGLKESFKNIMVL